MNIYSYPKREVWKELTQRPVLDKKNLNQLMSEIFCKVEKEGDKALKMFTKKFDDIDLENLVITEEEIAFAVEDLDPSLKLAIQSAKENIEKFHRSQTILPQKIETTRGVVCWQESRAIEKIGVYVPGGTAPLFSTVLMLVVPAQIAGCQEIILCTPPDKSGTIHSAILYTAQLCGVTKIIKVGGAQAIAGLTLGTESIPKTYKIFGPGNQYVTSAKQYATELGVAIDMPAGPSEVLLIADEYAIPQFCASDLLSQAEHGVDSQIIFLSTHQKVFDKTLEALEKQLKQLPRKEFIQKSIANSRFILFNTLQECIDFSNLYAPEHLILALKEAETYAQKVKNTGSVFLGNYSCESAGDYASGTNHTLPTNGYAKNYSGVSLDSFVKKVTFQKLTQEGLKNIASIIETMAKEEGLEAHKNAVTIRLKQREE